MQRRYGGKRLQYRAGRVKALSKTVIKRLVGLAQQLRVVCGAYALGKGVQVVTRPGGHCLYGAGLGVHDHYRACGSLTEKHAVQHEVQPFLQLVVNRELKVQSVLGGLGVQCAAVGALRGANVYMVAVIASQLFFVFGLQTVAANVGIRGIQAVLGIPALVQLLEPGLQLFIAAGADYAYIA